MTATTAAGAAATALSWAHRAEAAERQFDEYRKRARDSEARRRNSDAAHARSVAEHWEQFRGRSVDMANMWASVAGALHLVEKGEPS
ncbi:hypothetical protein ABZ468_08085 [Streptomyces sp. NPDC005708]|uniref:hypothetical protein n=1 Tax=Streptomyces sp. NPDC005708 TaxID=3154564 RepID=UPI0033C5F9D5